MRRHAGLWLLAALFVVGLGFGYTIEAANRNALDAQHDAIAFTRRAQYYGCERGNALRLAVTRNQLVLANFLAVAAEARREQAAAGLGTLNRETAAGYDRLRRSIHPLGPVDCRRAIYG